MINRDYYKLRPAYGRDYKSKKEVEASFRAGHEFCGDAAMGFAYCGIEDFVPGTEVYLRYKKLTRVAVVTI